MQILNCRVALGGDAGNTVTKREITPAEVVVLQALHGNASVTHLKVVGDIGAVDHSVLRGDLELRYTPGPLQAGGGDIVRIMDLFPGRYPQLPETVADLDLNAAFFEPEATVGPVSAGEGLQALSLVELKKIAASLHVDPAIRKREDLMAAIEAARTKEQAAEEEGPVAGDLFV